MTTLDTSPEMLVPGIQATVQFALTELAANFLRVWCNVAPKGSAIQARIDAARLSRVLIYEGDAGPDHPLRLTFDKGGVYQLIAQEYVKGNAWGGGYDGDPRGAPTETTEGGEQDLAIYVAQRLTQQVGFGADQATLVLFVEDATIRRTTKAAHGEATPALINPTSDRAAIAAKSIEATVLTLIDMTTVDAAGDLGATLDDWIDEFSDHANSATFHETADDQGDLRDDYTGATSLSGIATALNKLRTRLGQHMLNSKENDPDHPEYQAPGGIDIHDEGGHRLDLQNQPLPITADAGNVPSIYAALGDFHRAFEHHRGADVHETQDTTNDITLPAGLCSVHGLFMYAISGDEGQTPAAPGQSTGASFLITSAGFQEA